MRLPTILLLLVGCSAEAPDVYPDPTRFVGSWHLTEGSVRYSYSDGRNSTVPAKDLGVTNWLVGRQGEKITLGTGCTTYFSPRGNTASLDPAPQYCSDGTIESGTMVLSSGDGVLAWSGRQSGRSEDGTTYTAQMDLTFVRN